MKIAIDASKAVNESAGIARYTEELIKNLACLYPQDELFLYFNFLRGNETKNKKIEKIVGGNTNIKSKIYRLPGWIKERIYDSSFAISQLWINNCNIAHATEFLSFDKGLKIPQILTVHDLTMIKFSTHRGKEATRHGKILKSACEKADKIISVSESTKRDLVKYFSVNPDKIRVVYPGINSNFCKIEKSNQVHNFIKNKYKIDFPFILFPGTIEPRKNIKNLLLAFDKISDDEKFSDYRLVIIGKKGWNTEEIYQIYENIKNREKVIFLNFVPDQDIIYFYNQAAFFCYPSLYEGFGFPVAEAMACGCPVVTSNVSSLPEVGGKAALYVDPNNVISIVSGLKKVILDTPMRKKMIELGLEQAKKFSWEKCAKEIHKIYSEVLLSEK